MHSCVPVKTTPLYIPAWTLPLVYEVILLAALVWNAIDRPRQSEVTLARALRNDGLLYLLVRSLILQSPPCQTLISSPQVLTLIRVIQLSFVATENPAYFILVEL